MTLPPGLIDEALAHALHMGGRFALELDDAATSRAVQRQQAEA
ncbi:hypothetical protein [Sphingobium bisphenolivorans]|nr:hypothetical protein [Sphingobium bisphenolivorans]